MTDTTHPARSTDFLSRLYDGELTPADHEAFAAHRSACDECRSAADAFAATLAAFRASPTAPPAADLSARILRKIRAQSPSRRPFGVMFGIDLRWAGLVIAALLVVLISTPLVSRRAPVVAAPPSSIPARILDPPAEAKAAAAQEARSNARAKAAPEPPAAASAPDRLAMKDEAAANVAQPPPARPDAREGPADEEKRRYAAAPTALAKSAPSSHSRAAADPSGGEASAGFASPSVMAETAQAPLRLSVEALDGQGSAPPLVSHPPDAQLSGLRGREFVLIVEAQGRVRAVQPSTGNGLVSPPQARPVDAAAATTAAVGDALRELRFAPGGRPRRLLVRIE